jgi:hypothetical protein
MRFLLRLTPVVLCLMALCGCGIVPWMQTTPAQPLRPLPEATLWDECPTWPQLPPRAQLSDIERAGIGGKEALATCRAKVQGWQARERMIEHYDAQWKEKSK